MYAKRVFKVILLGRESMHLRLVKINEVLCAGQCSLGDNSQMLKSVCVCVCLFGFDGGNLTWMWWA